MLRARKETITPDWNAAAEAVERAELCKLLRDRGILIYDARTIGNDRINQRLVREVRDAWRAEVNKPTKLGLFCEIVFGVKI